MKCWGSNVYGQAGFGDDVFMQTTPKEIPFDAPIQQISAGYYSTCALFVNGNAKCWGNNIYGTLGSSLGVVRNPAQNLYIALQGSILQIETSLFNTCVITDLPSTVCWGGTNYSGYSSSISSSPTINDPYILPDLNLGSSTVSIATGSITGINCAILASNKIKCWGSGAYSQTGLPQSIVTSFSGSVVMPASLSIEYYPHTGFVPESISIGSEHVCMKFTNSKFKCWGRNQAYELIGVSLGSFVWDATTATAYTWDALFGFRKIKAAHLETYLVDSSYKIYYWGWQSSIIINLPISILAQDVAGGSKFGCAIDYLGEEVQCWGDNIFGQLGSGDTVSTEYESPKPSMKIF
jgi:alpha-tubulin suppressor-like RCC1 family protein